MSARLLRGYLFVVMVGLFLQGLGSLFYRLIPALPAHSPLLVRGVFGIDFWHCWIHIIWGAGATAVLYRQPSTSVAARLAVIFGVFYTAFGVLGVSVHHPMGLQLDLYENVFHLTAGPLTLIVGLLAVARFGWTERPTGTGDGVAVAG